jgi:hypothetical protein
MAERRAATACLFQEQVAERLRSMTGEEIAALSPHALIRWFDIAVTVERQARGMLTEFQWCLHEQEHGAES